ncbi:hypothetical protein L211DRAFT_790944 [Terfezia boudieri ATCC MYA-4762]|uniref:Uncharacterized protein n=1 Tax=Terfezia boudieri ATCC MYA-4762 TaxID=1051890 RepID=A0A3N4LT35_9PEZI|nr:hypothetical protein L211DRAFT_790944 [Terfezia boudieri ATCC MYA-4762]
MGKLWALIGIRHDISLIFCEVLGCLGDEKPSVKNIYKRLHLPILWSGHTQHQSSTSTTLGIYQSQLQIMQPISIFSLLLIAASIAQARINGPCSVELTPGVCISTASCKKGGGRSHRGYCPNDPADIKCCTKTSCGTGGWGDCRWTSQCFGTTISNKCPGPAEFKCCLPWVNA